MVVTSPGKCVGGKWPNAAAMKIEQKRDGMILF